MASVQPQHRSRQVSITPPPLTYEWDEVFTGDFTRAHQRQWQQAVTQVTEQLCAKLRVDVVPERLRKALDLVLAGAVTLHDDGTATVKSGTRTYTLAPDCTCGDAQHRAEFCKHALAVEVHRRTCALLQGTASASAPAAAETPDAPPSAPSPAAPAVASAPAAPPAAPTSATWQVHEAPARACFKFRVGRLELMYTLRGVDDAELQGRIRATLPLLQEIMQGCEDAHAARLAARAPDFCALHQTPMYLNQNERGTWYSHLAMDDQGQEYFCKGRPRRASR